MEGPHGGAFGHDDHHWMSSWWQGVSNALSWTGASDPGTWTEVERYTLDAVLARQQTERQSFGGSLVATAYVQNAAHFPTQVGAESRTVHHGFLNGDGLGAARAPLRRRRPASPGDGSGERCVEADALGVQGPRARRELRSRLQRGPWTQ